MYIATTGNGPRLPVFNRRVDPTEAGQYELRTDIVMVVNDPEGSGTGVCRLYERPATNYGGAGVVVENYENGFLLEGSTTWPPQSEKFYISPYLGRVYFHTGVIGTRMKISYSGMGSIIDAVDMNHVNEKAEQASTPFKQVLVPASGSLNLPKEVVIAVFYDNGSYWTPNPSFIDVQVFEPTNVDNYRSLLVNSTSTDQPLLVKTLKHHEADQ